ncbi:response regulator with CheY-like receiver domain and winged-helix DNA-binding domain [Desulfitobacterium dehalogenans ATCC 51507]|uniref:Stage 0 sporulation protein A homolog n=1 Tax=Desulfitobacterium dehalogenans (strain ATCC 51507 / DSM 9161 / JW/IU-DC1) TaxID=756499 RepID=I4A8E1_DESDJ|nr:response regulator with CheY-like receiver domain and winged-helix DNA-binding domain [Desulfitobacterium dehalogenans ATCC 51507]
MRLLLAEDELELANALTMILKHNNYSVDAVYNGADALDWALAGNYDGILMDIMMPNGLEVLTKLREKGISTPILMLTAKGEIEDRIEGLDHGADDYLTKPFAMGELLARIRAITRRKTEFAPNLLTVGNLQLNRTNYELSSEKGSLRLGNKEYQMMEMMMSSPNRLISTEQFKAEVLKIVLR